MEWTLDRHGDDIERENCRWIRQSFPKYEKFWSKNIVPMTNRKDTQQGVNKLWFHFRKGLDKNIQQIAMSHYSIILNLLYIRDLSNIQLNVAIYKISRIMYEKRTDRLFTAYATIADLIENIFFNVCKLRKKLKIDDHKDLFQKLNEDEINAKTKSFCKAYLKKDSKIFDNFLQLRKPVNIRIHNTEASLKVINKEARKQFLAWANQVRVYRNAIIHSPQMGRFYDISGTQLIPKDSVSVEKYSFWADIIYEQDPNKFINLEQLIKDLSSNLSENIDLLWTDLLKAYDEITQKETYTALLGEIIDRSERGGTSNEFDTTAYTSTAPPQSAIFRPL